MKNAATALMLYFNFIPLYSYGCWRKTFSKYLHFIIISLQFFPSLNINTDFTIAVMKNKKLSAKWMLYNPRRNNRLHPTIHSMVVKTKKVIE